MHSTCLPAPFVMLALLLAGADNCSSTIFRTSKNIIDLLCLTESSSFSFFHVGKTGCGPLQVPSYNALNGNNLLFRNVSVCH